MKVLIRKMKRIIICGTIAALFLTITSWLIFTISSSEIWEEEQFYCDTVRCGPAIDKKVSNESTD